MMVETILESSQDFGMSNGALPQWKRELLQRRAARSRPTQPPPQPPPPPPPPPHDEEDEELRYGPGIVKRLKSRYLSLALRDAPRRRPSVLRRAASLEHLLDERPPPAPARRPRAPAPASTSVVFNFSNRKEVPDYIENDGIVLRASRRNRIKAGEPGVVVLRPELLAPPDSDSETETDGAPPSPCRVRFVNDNVLINGRSSMPCRPNKDRISKLKLQFDDSLTRTFEYPSETSLCEEAPGAAPAAPAGPGAPAPAAPGAPAPEPEAPAPDATPQLAESPLHATLAANTHITSAALARYTPHKTPGAAFQLGVTRGAAAVAVAAVAVAPAAGGAGDAGGAGEDAEGDARPCGADAARSWSEARTHATDLLF